MSVLLLRLAGPMQSWGTEDRFPVRGTGREPSKSGVVGLLCAALGRPRGESVADLAALQMAVRVEREGRLSRDFHTALNVIKPDGSGTTSVISNRYYLADADFLIALEGDRSLLVQLDQAVREPVWPLFLGRKAFVPGVPVSWPADRLPIREGTLMKVLEAEPWRPRRMPKEQDRKLRYVLQVEYGHGEPRQDEPEPLSFTTRRFAVRHVEVDFLPNSRKGHRLPPIHPLETPHVSEPTLPERP